MGLGAPPYGYRWIRYGPDMLLVEVRSRRVVDVVYGAFY
jgi:Ni/Co efflux regulator RcnB